MAMNEELECGQHLIIVFILIAFCFDEELTKRAFLL